MSFVQKYGNLFLLSGKDEAMRIVKLLGVLLVFVCVVLMSGCAGVDSLKVQNQTQRKRISELESQLQVANLKLEQANRQLESTGSRSSIELDALKQKTSALEEDLAKRKNMISSMQQQLMTGGAALPVELSVMLEDFAKSKPDMITYDSSRGVVKFMSDLVFASGSDKVELAAESAIKALCDILNSEQGKQFDVIIAGHTDDVRIGKASTREKHPTNWHLSAHRAISVVDVMAKNNIASERMSVRGFGEYRPLEPNKPSKKGNPANRRVEIYIVPKGA
jgi:chemotaxis protein MotB